MPCTTTPRRGGRTALPLWALLCSAACAPPTPDPVGADAGLALGDATATDAPALDGASDGPLVVRDAGDQDVSPWREDAGVSYESYLPCLSGAAVTLASCFDDARNRATALGPLGLQFARAAGSFDDSGQVPAERPGLVYRFCLADDSFYECVSVEYWWSGVTAQITALRLHRAREGAARSRLPTQPPDSPAIIAAFLATPECDLGAAGYADINLFSEDGSDRVQVSSSADALLLSDPDLGVLQNLCVP